MGLIVWFAFRHGFYFNMRVYHCIIAARFLIKIRDLFSSLIVILLFNFINVYRDWGNFGHETNHTILTHTPIVNTC